MSATNNEHLNEYKKRVEFARLQAEKEYELYVKERQKREIQHNKERQSLYKPPKILIKLKTTL